MSLDVFYNVRDEKGDVSTVTIPIPGTTTPTNAVAFVQAMAGILDPLVNGELVNAGVTMYVSVPDWTGGLVGLADVQERAKFLFRTAIGNFAKILRIPAFDETKILAGTKEVDTTDTDVNAFVAAMTGGVDVSGHGGVGSVAPCDVRDYDLGTLESAVEDWGKARS